LLRRPRVAIISDGFEVEWRFLKSAKPGEKVLTPPVMKQVLDFTELFQGWTVDSIENVDVVVLLKEVAKKEDVAQDALDYSLTFLEGQRDGSG